MAGIPPRPPTGHIRCERVRRGETRKLTILSDRLLLVPYHGGAGRNLLCPRYLGCPCHRCGAGDAARQERWAEALWHDPPRVVIQAFTEGAVRHCPDLLRWLESAHGLVVELSRLGSAYQGVKAKVIARRDQPHHKTPRPVCDVHEKVMSLYGRNIPDSPGMLLFRDNADIESQDIRNVSEELPAPQSATTQLPNDPFPDVPAAREDLVPFGVPMPEESSGDHVQQAEGGGALGGCAISRIWRPGMEASAPEDRKPHRLTAEEIRNALRRAQTRDSHGNNGQVG